MKLDREYIEAIKANDTLGLQMMLVMIIYSDEGFNTNRFIDTLQAIKKVYPQIIVPYSGKLNLNKAQWNEDYYNQSLAELRSNFSQERIDHVMEIGRYLHGQTGSVVQQPQVVTNVNVAKQMQNDYQKQRPKTAQAKSSSEKLTAVRGEAEKKTLSTIAFAGATVIGVSGLIKESLPLMLGAVVLGGIGIYSLQPKKK